MNWLSVAFNALWILALAWAIAFLGITYWESYEKKVKMREIVAQARQRGSINLILMVFSLGLGLVTVPIWGKVLWFMMALAFLINAWTIFYPGKK